MAIVTMSKCWHCGKPAATYSPYSKRTVCPKCLKQERQDAVTLEGVLQAEYRDAADTERDLLAGLHW